MFENDETVLAKHREDENTRELFKTAIREGNALRSRTSDMRKFSEPWMPSQPVAGSGPALGKSTSPMIEKIQKPGALRKSVDDVVHRLEFTSLWAPRLHKQIPTGGIR